MGKRKFKTIEGRLGTIDLDKWVFPYADNGTMDWYFDMGLIDVDGALEMIKPYMKNYRRVIQAGAAVGIWPMRLAQVFEKVSTFEPEDINRQCLMKNIKGVDNIDVYPYALSSKAGDKVRMVLEEPRMIGHCGAFQVEKGGDIETVTIDDYAFDDVDLIYLDIEGSEYSALEGARKTIERCKPIIGIEEKGFHNRYNNGAKPHDLLRAMGYRVLGKPYKDDIVFIHA